MIRQTSFPVIGMMCASCSASVERRLQGLEGILSVSVSLPGRQALVEYDTALITPERMRQELEAAGYTLVTDDTARASTLEHRRYTLLRRRTLLAWILALAVMAVSMGWISLGAADTARQTALILSLLTMACCGREFYLNALRQTLHRSASMDTLIALSTLVAFTFSTFNTFCGDDFWGSRHMEWHTYYDAVTMIIAFVLTGRLLEERARRATASAIRGLMGLVPRMAHLVDGNSITDVPIATLAVGDTVEVRAGEKVPVDGTVTEGEGDVDESMITGEAEAAVKHAAAQVFSGTMLRRGTLRVRTDRTAGNTVLSGIIRCVEQAQASKAPVQRLVDRVALVFVPTVIVLSLLTFVLWTLVGGAAGIAQAMLCAVSVLVIACPCSLGLATPTALMVGIGLAARRGILIKDATALERLCRVNALVSDKTGTLTIPRAAFSADLQAGERERLRPQAREAVSSLSKAGVSICLMSGDTEEAVSQCAQAAGIQEWTSRVMPEDKERKVRALQAEGRCVAMLGDGVNDAPALAAADVGIAMGQGTDVAMDVASVTLMTGDLSRVAEGIRLSRLTVRTVRENLFWAFVYNVVCIPLAAGLPLALGLAWQVTPTLASALMAFSSVSVVLNSLRLRLTAWV